jgi:hypothetical protein
MLVMIWMLGVVGERDTMSDAGSDAGQTFWIMLDALVAASEVRIDRPRGAAHPRYPEVV